MSLVAPRDTFDGVGVGRKTGSEAKEAIRRGHFFSDAQFTDRLAFPPVNLPTLLLRRRKEV